MKGAKIVKSQLKESQPVIYDGGTDVEINNFHIKGQQTSAIIVKNVNGLVIRDVLLESIGRPAIYLYRCKDVFIFNWAADEINSGVYALECENVNIYDFSVRNVSRVKGTNEYGQAVQFDKCFLGDVYLGMIENELGKSNPEDLINFYKSSGTKEQPMRIRDCWAKGGGPSATGGGFLLGDGGESEWQEISNCILVNPGQYGLAIAGGSNMSVVGNDVYGKKQDFSNVGIYAWNQYSTPSSNNKIIDNRVNWVKSDGNVWNGIWIHPNAGIVDTSGNNKRDESLTEEILPETLYNPFIEEDSSVPTGGDVTPEKPTEENTMEPIFIDFSKAESLQYVSGNPPQTDKYVFSEADGKEIYIQIPLPANGTYKAKIKAVEDYWSNEGQRVFDIYINSMLRLTGIDLIKVVGKNNIWEKELEFKALAGYGIFMLDPSVNRALISSIEITPMSVEETDNINGQILEDVETGKRYRVIDSEAV